MHTCGGYTYEDSKLWGKFGIRIFNCFVFRSHSLLSLVFTKLCWKQPLHMGKNSQGEQIEPRLSRGNARIHFVQCNKFFLVLLIKLTFIFSPLLFLLKIRPAIWVSTLVIKKVSKYKIKNFAKNWCLFYFHLN